LKIAYKNCDSILIFGICQNESSISNTQPPVSDNLLVIVLPIVAGIIVLVTIFLLLAFFVTPLRNLIFKKRKVTANVKFLGKKEKLEDPDDSRSRRSSVFIQSNLNQSEDLTQSGGGSMFTMSNINQSGGGSMFTMTNHQSNNQSGGSMLTMSNFNQSEDPEEE